MTGAHARSEHYQQILNHAPATQCPELDVSAVNAVPADDICEDAPTLEEVQKTIRKLRNGRAAGPDDITPELLKTAEIPISMALHQLFLLIWKLGKVPADWKEAVIISLYKGKGCLLYTSPSPRDRTRSRMPSSA